MLSPTRLHWCASTGLVADAVVAVGRMPPQTSSLRDAVSMVSLAQSLLEQLGIRMSVKWLVKLQVRRATWQRHSCTVALGTADGYVCVERFAGRAVGHSGCRLGRCDWAGRRGCGRRGGCGYEGPPCACELPMGLQARARARISPVALTPCCCMRWWPLPVKRGRVDRAAPSVSAERGILCRRVRSFAALQRVHRVSAVAGWPHA